MKTKVMSEIGTTIALFGLGLSHGLTSEFDYSVEVSYDLWIRLRGVAEKLAHRGGGHNKFLESMTVYLDIDAPRYWWQEFDTYRVGVTKQSESTMHTITKRRLTEDDFQDSEIHSEFLYILNKAIDEKDFRFIKKHLPEGFLQRRIVCTNYKALQNMVAQRITHRLPEWQEFCESLREQLDYPNFVFKGKGENVYEEASSKIFGEGKKEHRETGMSKAFEAGYDKNKKSEGPLQWRHQPIKEGSTVKGGIIKDKHPPVPRPDSPKGQGTGGHR